MAYQPKLLQQHLSHDAAKTFGQLRTRPPERYTSMVPAGTVQSLNRSEELARRFRRDYGSDQEGHANVVPYFIGVFDTVAALGAKGFKRLLINITTTMAALGVAAVVALVASLLGVPFFAAFVVSGSILLLAILVAALHFSVRTIRDYPSKGDLRWHLAGWHSGFYDRFLDPRVRFGRHALAIDETREDFARVPWGQEGVAPAREPDEPEWLRQIWFAGCHSDVGGSYAEEESRLSDIALGWMIEETLELPHPLLIDATKLRLFPDPAGVQHSEVEALRNVYPRWIPRACRRSWNEKPRVEARGAPMHPSVLERFKLPAVAQCAEVKPYRPASLGEDDRFRQYYLAE